MEPLNPKCASPALLAVIDEWELENCRRDESLAAQLRAAGASIDTGDMVRVRAEIRSELRAEAARFIGYFERDNSSLSAQDLARIAEAVSPGGMHDGAELLQIIFANGLYADPLLVAATTYHNWHGGKVGFQFLPDPASMDGDEYWGHANSLVDDILSATDWNPRRILDGADLAFFDALPESFTVYRGCFGVSAEVASHGVCWTISRAMAEWFARRFDRHGQPILVSARVRKWEVALVNSSEAEIVVQPRKARSLRVRPWSRDRLQRVRDADTTLVSWLASLREPELSGLEPIT